MSLLGKHLEPDVHTLVDQLNAVPDIRSHRKGLKSLIKAALQAHSSKDTPDAEGKEGERERVPVDMSRLSSLTAQTVSIVRDLPMFCVQRGMKDGGGTVPLSYEHVLRVYLRGTIIPQIAASSTPGSCSTQSLLTMARSLDCVMPLYLVVFGYLIHSEPYPTRSMMGEVEHAAMRAEMYHFTHSYTDEYSRHQLELIVCVASYIIRNARTKWLTGLMESVPGIVSAKGSSSSSSSFPGIVSESSASKPSSDRGSSSFSTGTPCFGLGGRLVCRDDGTQRSVPMPGSHGDTLVRAIIRIGLLLHPRKAQSLSTALSKRCRIDPVGDNTDNTEGERERETSFTEGERETLLVSAIKSHHLALRRLLLVDPLAVQPYVRKASLRNSNKDTFQRLSVSIAGLVMQACVAVMPEVLDAALGSSVFPDHTAFSAAASLFDTAASALSGLETEGEGEGEGESTVVQDARETLCAAVRGRMDRPCVRYTVTQTEGEGESVKEYGWYIPTRVLQTLNILSLAWVALTPIQGRGLLEREAKRVVSTVYKGDTERGSERDRVGEVLAYMWDTACRQVFKAQEVAGIQGWLGIMQCIQDMVAQGVEAEDSLHREREREKRRAKRRKKGGKTPAPSTTSASRSGTAPLVYDWTCHCSLLEIRYLDYMHSMVLERTTTTGRGRRVAYLSRPQTVSLDTEVALLALAPERDTPTSVREGERDGVSVLALVQSARRLIRSLMDGEGMHGDSAVQRVSVSDTHVVSVPFNNVSCPLPSYIAATTAFVNRTESVSGVDTTTGSGSAVHLTPALSAVAAISRESVALSRCLGTLLDASYVPDASDVEMKREKGRRSTTPVHVSSSTVSGTLSVEMAVGDTTTTTHTVRLTPLQHAVMTYMLSQPGQCVTAAKLRDATVGVSPETLSAHILPLTGSGEGPSLINWDRERGTLTVHPRGLSSISLTPLTFGVRWGVDTDVVMCDGVEGTERERESEAEESEVSSLLEGEVEGEVETLHIVMSSTARPSETKGVASTGSDSLTVSSRPLVDVQQLVRALVCKAVKQSPEGVSIAVLRQRVQGLWVERERLIGVNIGNSGDIGTEGAERESVCALSDDHFKAALEHLVEGAFLEREGDRVIWD
ncbi:hypothetical protein KIPB_002496 [Kipferlia bialata]|uniref:Uncharacterized protein n=1 Tax=Kipferlia bialata TaxID=797122 RepID=A0A9K3GGA9_9EUKA|nr:hypothetical protein KIPB_002496 [Kipferlia bialata]|eukprot:g2496.t1